MCDMMEPRCRLCAECSRNQLAILQDPLFCSKIFQLFQIKVSISDSLPTSVCPECYDMVEKTWSFNDRIQKAQDILSELANNFIEMLPGTENLHAPVIVDAPPDTTDMLNLCYMEIKAEENLLPEQAVAFSDESDKCDQGENVRSSVVCRKRKIRVSRSKTRKNAKKKAPPQQSSQSENLQLEVNEDGDPISKAESGWESYPFPCCDCQVIFPTFEELKEHYSSVHNSSARYACADCPKVYTKYTVFLAHAKVHRTRLKLCCDICYKWFPTAAEQEEHRSQHGDDRPHVCGACGKRFRMQSALVVHARSHLPAEIKNQYQCDQCPKKFGTKPNLMAHKRIHTGIKDYTCDQCGKSFVQKGNLDNHMLTHTAARPFNCDSCGKSFKTLVRLRKHVSVHSGLKPHKCDTCGRQFRERGTLKEHHRIHTGAMPFACEFCGKCFRFKGVLTTHRRQHTGERPYSCNECQHHFTNWPNYNKHMKRRHGINTSVTCRTRQDIPPTGMPHRNPPGTVLAPPLQPEPAPQPPLPPPPPDFVEMPPAPQTFYPVLNLYNIPDELLHQQRV